LAAFNFALTESISAAEVDRVTTHCVTQQCAPVWSNGIHLARGRQDNISPQSRVSTKAATLDAETTRNAALTVTTSDGDTVSISLSAFDQLHSETFRGGTKDSRVAYGGTSAASGASVQISVDGSLDVNEVADITDLLGQLNQAIVDPSKTPDPSQFTGGGSLDSLRSFQFAYQQQTSVAYSTSRLPGYA
jgi:hypothetical protein